MNFVKSRKFGVFLWIFSIFGIVSQISIHFYKVTSGDILLPITIFNYYLSPFVLFFFDENIPRLLYGPNLDINLINIDLLNIYFILLLILAALLYTISKGKENRLGLFLFSVIFLNQTANIILYIIPEIILGIKNNFQNFELIRFVIVMGKMIMYSLVTYYVILQEKKSEELLLTNEVSELTGLAEYKLPSKWVRILHQIIDVFILVLIYSIYNFGWAKPFLESFNQSFGEKSTLLLFFVLVGFLYYTLSEILFGATPAKFLTNTRVVNNDFKPASKYAILLRTLYKRIPFNGFSFLEGAGWHDKLSKTKLVYIKNNGVKGSLYLIILPITFLLIKGSSYAYFKYDNYIVELGYQDEFNKNVNAIDLGLSNIKTNCVIVFEQQESIMRDVLYLKVERITPDSIYGIFIPNNIVKSDSPYELEKGYAKLLKQESTSVAVSFNDLKSSFYRNYQDMINQNTIGLKIPNMEYKLTLVKVIVLGGTNFLCTYTSPINLEVLSIRLCNDGWPGTIKNVKIINQGLHFDSLSNNIPRKLDEENSCFNLDFTNYKMDSPYVFTMDVQDVNGNLVTYIVSGVNYQNSIKKIKRKHFK